MWWQEVKLKCGKIKGAICESPYDRSEAPLSGERRIAECEQVKVVSLS